MYPINPSKISRSALKLSPARLQTLNKHFCMSNNRLSSWKENATEEFYLKLTENPRMTQSWRFPRLFFPFLRSEAESEIAIFLETE